MILTNLFSDKQTGFSEKINFDLDNLIILIISLSIKYHKLHYHYKIIIFRF